jgi:hypothetical protein
MLSSATYRQASHAPEGDAAVWEQGIKVDPENRLLWHMRRQRLEGEAIRDCMLAAADRLSPRTGGPGVMPPLPEELVSTLLRDHWTPSPDEEDHRRRSVYLFARRNLRYPLFEAFDRPEAATSCPRRTRSTIAPQSLLLLNSEFSLQCAQDLTRFVQQHGGDKPPSCVELLYRRVLGRQPTTAEQASAEAFLYASIERQRQLAGRNEHELSKSLTLLALAMFNLNEFVYVD